MSTTDMQDESASTTKISGSVKWFNNKAGYGFINVTSGDKKGSDVFVHHSAISVEKEQYKYLVQGEHVEFNLHKADSDTHEYQAADIRGPNNSKLMCETRYENRDTRTSDSRTSDSRTSDSRSNTRNSSNNNEFKQTTHTKFRRNGPREGEEWLLVKRRISNTSSNRSTMNYSPHN